MTRHVLSVLVTNRPGVLTRVSGLFARRGYNIESLTVSPTDDPSESRMTIGVNVVSAQALEQIVKQLNKLIEVHKIVDLCHSVFFSLLVSGLSWGLGDITRSVSPRGQQHRG